jgi:hypothetical protein
MKNLRNFYFILGIFALAFAILTKAIPAFRAGSPVFDFANGFCWGLGTMSLVAGIVTATIPYFYRKDHKNEVPQPEEESEIKN